MTSAPTENLEQRLSALVADRRWESPGSLNGCAATEGRAIELDMVPPDRKLMMRVTDASAESQLYYLKTEGYDPQPFHMPNGKIQAGTEYRVHGIAQTEVGLQISVEGGFMYADSLDGLAFEIVAKDPVELANDHIKGPEVDQKALGNYEFNQVTVARLRAELARAEETLEGLEEFPVESTVRYSIDPSGVQAGRFRAGELGELQGFGRLHEPQLHGEFHGNRFAVVGHRLMLIDDERGLAVCPAFNEKERIVLGFRSLKVVDTEQGTHRQRSVNDELAERLEVSLTAASS